MPEYDTTLPAKKSYNKDSKEVALGKESERTVARLLSEELSYTVEDISEEPYKDRYSPFDIYATRPDRSILVDAKRQSASNAGLWIWTYSVDNKNEYSIRSADFKIIIFQVRDRFLFVTMSQVVSLGYRMKEGGFYLIEHHMAGNLGKSSLRFLDLYLDKLQECV